MPEYLQTRMAPARPVKVWPEGRGPGSVAWAMEQQKEACQEDQNLYSLTGFFCGLRPGNCRALGGRGPAQSRKPGPGVETAAGQGPG